MKLHKILLSTIFAATALFAASCSNSGELRIMSYNVHHCRGMDDSISYNRIAEVINRVNPEVVALQELDSATRRNNGKVCIEELAKETGMHPSYTSAIRFGGGSYGIGLLSKQKPIATRAVKLESRGEARRLLIAEFENYIICCTHFPLNADDRKASARIILDSLTGYEKPIFLVGDMNSHSTSPEQAELVKEYQTLNNPEECTFPSISPKECIDFIYAREKDYIYKVTESRVLFADSIASDHLPLYVNVQYE